MASEQLSKQPHYDFGMRALKAALVMAGGLRRAQPSSTEVDILIQAMRDSNIPKFTSADAALFEDLIRVRTSTATQQRPDCTLHFILQCGMACNLTGNCNLRQHRASGCNTGGACAGPLSQLCHA
jgi:Hydrolytic ATP binding site of dynein motor region